MGQPKFAKRWGIIQRQIRKYKPIEDIVSTLYNNGGVSVDEFNEICPDLSGCPSDNITTPNNFFRYLEKNEIVEKHQYVPKQGVKILKEGITLTKNARTAYEKLLAL